MEPAGSSNMLTTLTSSPSMWRSEEHTSELQSQSNLVCRLLLEKKKKISLRYARRLETAPAVRAQRGNAESTGASIRLSRFHFVQLLARLLLALNDLALRDPRLV